MSGARPVEQLHLSPITVEARCKRCGVSVRLSREVDGVEVINSRAYEQRVIREMEKLRMVWHGAHLTVCPGR